MTKNKKKLSTEARDERRRLPDPRAAPWLVYTHGQGKQNQTFYNVCDEPIDENTHLKCLPEISGKSFWQSPTGHGWLIVLCKDVQNEGHFSNFSSKWKLGDCYLWNPVSSETIQLPSLLDLMNDEVHKKEYYLRDSVLSSSPNDLDSDPMVFLFYAGVENDNYLVLLCRPGVDKVWRGVGLPLKHGLVRGMFCFQGKLHISCYCDNHIEIIKRPIDDDDPADVKYTSATHEPFTQLGGKTAFVDNFVVTHDGVFKVVRIYHPFIIDKEIVTLEVFKMDFSIMTWVKVKSLGNHVLFIGNNTTASCLASEMGLSKGCVYFTHGEDKSLYTFDLEDDSISVIVPCRDLPTPWSSPNWLMMPTMIRVASDGIRRAEAILNSEEQAIIIEAMQNIRVGQKSNGAELQESGTWGILNQGILVMIASFLHPVDHIHFRSVCPENRSAIPAVNWRTTSTDIIHTTSLSPWLVFARKDDPIYNFVDPMHDNEKYHMNLSEYLLDAKIRFSKGGWLLMSRGKKTVFFFNPFTRERISLPEFPADYEYMFNGISFSSSPTSPDSVVFAIAEWGMEEVFIMYIPRGAPTWSYGIFKNTMLRSSEKCMEFMPWFNTPVFYNGVFCCLDYNGTIGVFDPKDHLSWRVYSHLVRPCNSVSQSFLLECEGDLLSVFLGHLGSRVRIYRLDCNRMAWVEVKNLGKHMLCISHTSYFSKVAPKSWMENKIYFSRFHGEAILFYSLDTGRYHSWGSPHSAPDFHNTKKQLNCSWIEPNWSRSTVQELDWSTGTAKKEFWFSRVRVQIQ